MKSKKPWWVANWYTDGSMMAVDLGLMDFRTCRLWTHGERFPCTIWTWPELGCGQIRRGFLRPAGAVCNCLQFLQASEFLFSENRKWCIFALIRHFEVLWNGTPMGNEGPLYQYSSTYISVDSVNSGLLLPENTKWNISEISNSCVWNCAPFWISWWNLPACRTHDFLSSVPMLAHFPRIQLASSSLAVRICCHIIAMVLRK